MLLNFKLLFDIVFQLNYWKVLYAPQSPSVYIPHWIQAYIWGTLLKHKLLFYIFFFFFKYVLQLLDSKTNFNLSNVHFLLPCRRKVCRIGMSELTLFCPSSQLFSQCYSLHNYTSNQLVSFTGMLLLNYFEETISRRN